MKEITIKTKKKIKDSFEVVNSETSNNSQPQNLMIRGWVGDALRLRGSLHTT